MRDFQLPGRSTVHAAEGMAACSHPLATLTAVETLRAGGNAMDAAVAAAAVLAVVEPAMTGIGGDVFTLFSLGGTDKIIGFNGSGRAPAAATVEKLRGQGLTEIAETSAHSVTVPGAVDAWARLVADHGRKDLGFLLQPAIRYAEQGAVIAPKVAWDWARQHAKLAADPNAARIFMKDGRDYRPGERHQQPQLAETLKRIAREGRDGFYKGPVAEDIVKTLIGKGGLHTMDDLAATAGEYVEPISIPYRGWRVHQIPPNGQGITILMMMRLLEGFDMTGLDPVGAERFHLEIEASRLAFRDRDERVADMRYAKVPIEQMLSEERLTKLRASIDRERAMTNLPPSGFPEHKDTVYLCVVDRDRNAVSFINSVFASFGSGIVTNETGVVLQNRGQSFRLDPRHPNRIEGGKRPMHTIIPGMVTRDGRAVMPYGVMGGHYQPVGHTQVLNNMLDFDMDPQEAIDNPRAFHRDGKVEVERGIPAATVAGLQKLGHQVVTAEAPIGGAQAIWIDWQTGTLMGGSEPRKDGCALGY